MKKFIIIVALGLALSGCVTSGTVTSAIAQLQAGVSVGTVTSAIAQFQAGVRAACGYVPLASSAANILATFVSGGVLVVGAIESAVSATCSALSAKAGRFGSHGTVRVRGVVLRGRYVR